MGALSTTTSDQMLVLYLASMIRGVIALHNLIDNKVMNLEEEKANEAKPDKVPNRPFSTRVEPFAYPFSPSACTFDMDRKKGKEN